MLIRVFICDSVSAQAWTLYKVPQWNARYPNSCPEANKAGNALRLRTKAFIAGLVQRRWTPWSKPKHGFDNYHKK
jgi:hypothetical protein